MVLFFGLLLLSVVPVNAQQISPPQTLSHPNIPGVLSYQYDDPWSDPEFVQLATRMTQEAESFSRELLGPISRENSVCGTISMDCPLECRVYDECKIPHVEVMNLSQYPDRSYYQAEIRVRRCTQPSVSANARFNIYRGCYCFPFDRTYSVFLVLPSGENAREKLRAMRPQIRLDGLR